MKLEQGMNMVCLLFKLLIIISVWNCNTLYRKYTDRLNLKLYYNVESDQCFMNSCLLQIKLSGFLNVKNIKYDVDNIVWHVDNY